MAIVTVTSGRNFQNVVDYGDGKTFVCDEPENLGGDGAGPDPYSLFLGAVGGCTSMTVSMYARRKSWNLKQVIIELSSERIHAQDCVNCETKSDGFIQQIKMSIRLVGDLSEEQRARLLEIAQKCPLKKTLTSEITFSYSN